MLLGVGLLHRIGAAGIDVLDVGCRVDVVEDDETVTASLTGGDLGVVIGRHGQTIDAIQYLANAIVWRSRPDDRKDVIVDAAGYRERRRAALESLAVRSAEELPLYELDFDLTQKEGMTLVGDPDYVAREIRAEMRELGAGVLMALFQFGSLPHALAVKNIELFARTVLPELRRD